MLMGQSELPGPGYFTGPVVKTQNRFDTETLAR